MASCSVLNCGGKREFQFPKDESLKEKWLFSIGRPNLKPNRWNGLCSRHFRSSDYASEGFETGLPLKIRRLKRGTVPVLHTELPCPEASSKKPRNNEDLNLGDVTAQHEEHHLHKATDKVYKTNSHHENISCKLDNSSENFFFMLGDSETIDFFFVDGTYDSA